MSEKLINLRLTVTNANQTLPNRTKLYIIYSGEGLMLERGKRHAMHMKKQN
jgi:hypothetical protein